MSAFQPKAGRDDHYLPQGYLKGFIDPVRKKFSQPLWCYYIKTGIWRERSTKQIGYAEGLYDLPVDSPADVHPDITFCRFENEFPRVREKLIANNFVDWQEHIEFLLGYMQMIRARSPLYLGQQEAIARTNRQAKIVEVKTDESGGTGLVLDTMEPYPFSERQVRQWTISRMQEDIAKGPDWLRRYHWSLGYTDSPHDPVIATETTLVLLGQRHHRSIDEALADPATYVCFPLCWQACLIGTHAIPSESTRQFQPTELKSIRDAYIQNGQDFLISPRKLRL